MIPSELNFLSTPPVPQHRRDLCLDWKQADGIIGFPFLFF